MGEVPLMRYLFNKVGDGKSFSTYELKKQRSSKLSKLFANWQKGKQAAINAGFF